MLRRLKNTVLVLLLTALSLELCGWAFLSVQFKKSPLKFSFRIENILSELDFNRLKPFFSCQGWICYHKELGWWQPPNTSGDVGNGPITTDSFASRVSPFKRDKLFVATYGDSFTQGIEVNDKETYQYFLSKIIRAKVENYGIFSFGPDQALLYLMKNLKRGDRPSVVVLGLISESPNRLMNALRLFYTYPKSDISFGFKPILIKERDSWDFHRFAPNIPYTKSDLNNAIQQASSVDSFYRLRTEQLEFPYSLNTVRYLGNNGLKGFYPWPGNTPEANERLDFIVAKFLELSRAYSFAPVVLLWPMSEEQLNEGKPPHKLTPSMINSKRLLVVDIASEFRQMAKKFSEVYIKKTHPTKEGNRLISELLLHSLCRDKRFQQPEFQVQRALICKRIR